MGFGVEEDASTVARVPHISPPIWLHDDVEIPEFLADLRILQAGRIGKDACRCQYHRQRTSHATQLSHALLHIRPMSQSPTR